VKLRGGSQQAKGVIRADKAKNAMYVTSRTWRHIARNGCAGTIVTAQFKAGPIDSACGIGGKPGTGQRKGQAVQDKRVDQGAGDEAPPTALQSNRKPVHGPPRADAILSASYRRRQIIFARECRDE
jgi:hypothetical protein